MMYYHLSLMCYRLIKQYLEKNVYRYLPSVLHVSIIINEHIYNNNYLTNNKNKTFNHNCMCI